MLTSVVIPSFNSKHLLEKKLPRLLDAVDNVANNICELIIVDDLSSDDTVKFLNGKYKGKLKLIKHTKHRGFSAAVNTGVRASKGQFILILDNSVTPEINFLEKIEDLFVDKSVFAVSLQSKGSGPFQPTFNDGTINFRFIQSTSLKIAPTFYVSSEAGIYRKSIWNELGGMDEKIISQFYWSNVDICYRASKRGYTNLCLSNGVICLDSKIEISKKTDKYTNRENEINKILFVWKNIQSSALLTKHFRYLLKTVIKHPAYLSTIFMSMVKINLLLKLRNKEIKESKVSDEAVFQKYQ